MSIELLVQLAGGTFGICVAYVWYLVDKNKEEKIDKLLEAQHQAEIEAIRKQVLNR